MKVPEGLKYEITVEQAYPRGVPEIPDGYRLVRFGIPKKGEQFMPWNAPTTWNPLSVMVAGDDEHDRPRLIVVAQPPPKPRRWIVEELPDATQDIRPGWVFRGVGDPAITRVIAEAKITDEDVLEAVSDAIQASPNNRIRLAVVIALRKLGFEVV